MDDTPFQEVEGPRACDIHRTDVLQHWSAKAGHSWYSCVAPANARGLVLVQDQMGVQFYAPPSWFQRRYSLRDSGRFNLQWRVSPIVAVPGYHGRNTPATSEPS